MPKIVEKFETVDGKSFDTMVQAQRHEKDLLYKHVDTLINVYFDISHIPSIHKSAVLMMENPKLLRGDLQRLLRIIDSIIEDEDE